MKRFALAAAFAAFATSAVAADLNICVEGAYPPFSEMNADGAVADAPKDAFWKVGSGGHCIYIVPSLDLVIFKMGGRDGQFSPNDTGVLAGRYQTHSQSEFAV